MRLERGREEGRQGGSLASPVCATHVFKGLRSKPLIVVRVLRRTPWHGRGNEWVWVQERRTEGGELLHQVMCVRMCCMKKETVVFCPFFFFSYRHARGEDSHAPYLFVLCWLFFPFLCVAHFCLREVKGQGYRVYGVLPSSSRVGFLLSPCLLCSMPRVTSKERQAQSRWMKKTPFAILCIYLPGRFFKVFAARGSNAPSSFAF